MSHEYVFKCTEAKPCEAWNGFILKMSADLTTEVWRRQWSDFPGGVGEYAPNGKPVEEAGGSLGSLSEPEWTIQGQSRRE